jgi:predicted DsbA family dithiol-disulfide isomerase
VNGFTKVIHPYLGTPLKDCEICEFYLNTRFFLNFHFKRHVKFPMNKPIIKIGVVSDVVCPWCYIGKRRLEKAIAELSPRFTFEVEYFPFELNPQMPSHGVDQKDYLINKFGGEERYHQLTDHVTSIAAQEGLTFDYPAQKISPNTRNAHRLIQFAKEDQKQLAFVEALFKAYFTEGIDLSKTENLVAIAVAAGLDKEKTEAFLTSDAGKTEVELTELELQQSGITGVPFYVVDNKYGISGAQPSESFIKAFEEIASAGNVMVAGDSCDVDQKDC